MDFIISTHSFTQNQTKKTTFLILNGNNNAIHCTQYMYTFEEQLTIHLSAAKNVHQMLFIKLQTTNSSLLRFSTTMVRVLTIFFPPLIFFDTIYNAIVCFDLLMFYKIVLAHKKLSKFKGRPNIH